MSTFPENLEFTYAKEMKKDIEKLFHDAKSVAIDLRESNRASLACIQLLIAAKNKAKKDNIPIVIQTSDALSTIITELGLEEILEDKERT